MTHDEFHSAFNNAKQKQRLWIQAKAQWEHMSLWAVVNCWGIPDARDLNKDGTWKAPRKKK